MVFATMHGKEGHAQTPFREVLGADVFTVANLDTDQFGTFSGEIARTGGPVASARAKARLGMRLAETPFGLASEGSFSSGLGVLIEHHEVLMFIDDSRGLELVEGKIGTSPLPPGRAVPTVDAALSYAAAVDFPRQRLVIRGGADGEVIDKAANSRDELSAKVERLISHRTPVTIEPDFRAHHCPSRAHIIATLASRMAQRLATACAQCRTPGFGQVGIERGLPCGDCGFPTEVIAADILACGSCPHRLRVPRLEQRAPARWCDLCNP